jgi:hypothetical protein
MDMDNVDVRGGLLACRGAQLDRVPTACLHLARCFDQLSAIPGV